MPLTVRLGLLLLLLLTTGSGTGRAQPVTADHFARAAAYSRAHNGVALRVEQYSRLAFEDYAGGFDSDDSHKIYSGTKNFAAVAALYAQQEGLLSLDETCGRTLPEWRADRRGSITLDQLLSQTSGLSPNSSAIDNAHDQFAAALHVRLMDPPGARFHYGPEGYQAFGEILKRKLRPSGRTVEGYLRDRIFRPLGIDTPYWKHDDAGNPLLHAGLGLTAGDWAKFGEFTLRELTGEEEQPIAHNLFKRLFIGHAANPAYGMSFWLNRSQGHPAQKMIDLLPAVDGEQLYPGGPADVYAALGTAKQRLYIIPSRHLVIVRFAEGGNFSDGDFLSRLLTGFPHPDAHRH